MEISWFMVFCVVCGLALILMRFNVNQLMIWLITAIVATTAFLVGKALLTEDSFFALVILSVVSAIIGILTRLIAGFMLDRRSRARSGG